MLNLVDIGYIDTFSCNLVYIHADFACFDIKMDRLMQGLIDDFRSEVYPWID